ncbi:hypothetical protein Q4957_001990 [Campylobacter coli]|nr:hypothetical protein [Campylobacter coli]EEP2112754.1 hypothetical protein [Campylobacter coli]EGD3084215.1 hypothetical protein [Campylobacter coli]EGP4418332.1 hypothetical protein [Campylobacter coli]EGW1612512.1 hypothetical protein [Campylobacter coli]
MTKTQAFVDGFVGKPIKNECFNLWDLNAIIREKQAKLYCGLFLDSYKDEKGNFDIEKIALHAKVNIKTAKKYILEYEKENKK